MVDYFCSHSSQPVWDGVDFSRCWRQSVLPRLLPLAVLLSSLIVLIPTIIRRVLASRKTISLANDTLPDETIDEKEKPSLRRIEDHILLESVRSSIEDSVQTGTLDEREKTPVERLGDWVGVFGAAGYIIVDVVLMTTTAEKRWERLALFVYMLLLALTALPTTGALPMIRFVPQVHLVSVLWLFLPVQFMIFRSALLLHHRNSGRQRDHHNDQHQHRHHHHHVDRTFLFECILMGHTLAFLVAYCSVPFRTRLDGILDGLKAGKGNGARRKVVVGYAAEDAEAFTVQDNPAEPRSVISRALFSHVVPIVLRFYKTPLQVKDVPAIREDDTPAVSVANWRLDQQERERLASNTTGRNARKPTKFAFRLFWHFRQLFWLQTFWSIWAVIFAFFSPLSLQLLLRFVADRKSDDPNVAGKTPTHVAVLYVALMVIGQVGSSLSQSQILNTGRRICIRSRAVIITEIYCKALRRRDLSGAVGARIDNSNQAGTATDAAEKPKPEAVEANITNLVGVDAFFISEIAGYLYYFVTCILCIIVALYLLYRLLGISSLAGIAMMILLTPIQGFITKAFASTQKTLLLATDARLEAATEVLSSIKTIKFAAWENKFFDRMQKSRDHELGVLKHRFYIRVLANVMTQITPPLVTIVTFAFYTLYFKKPLTAAIAFTSLSLFSMIRTPLAAVLEMTTASTNAYVSAGRVEDFLDVEETLKYDQLSVAKAQDDPIIGFRGAVIKHAARKTDQEPSSTINTASTSENFRLELNDVKFPIGKLSIIVGSVGSGKSTLLNSLLGETTLLSGKIFMVDDRGDRELCPEDPGTGLTDTVAYCPQAPWLIGATIRENILFGRPYEQKRYNQVLSACALERDLEIFEDGDRTVVGEKGTVCSGGQKARIALARAVYSSARTLLCDDVTSAVDAHTASHLYKQCFKGPLMTGRTLILVTHAVGLVLPGTEYAVVLDGGEVLGVGAPDILKSEGHFAAEELQDDGEILTKHLGSDGDVNKLPHVEDGTMTIEDLGGHSEELEEVAKQVNKDKADPAAQREKFFKAEKQATGSISLSTYIAYFKYMGSFFYWVLLVLLFVFAQGTQIQTNNWIRSWANAVESSIAVLVQRNKAYIMEIGDRYLAASPKDDSLYYLVIYVVLNVVFGALVAGRTLATFQASLKASRVIYGQLLKAVLGARMRFFDSTPSGQILNRLSNDIQVVDQQAAEVLMLFVNSVLNTVAVLVVVTWATPAFFFAAVLISGLYAIIGALYNATSLEVKRCDSVTKSPILVGFGEVLQGQTSIRAYADTARFTRDLMTRLETNIRSFHLLWQNNRLLSVYCDLAGSLVIVFAAMLVLLNKNLSAGAAGLSLSYAMTFTDFVLWIVRLWAANEQNLTSVERLQEYLKLEPEAIPESKEPPAFWPTKQAKIEIENLTCAYAPQLPPVLKNVSFTVQPGERIGVCGRTGSGKSTLALSLFRFIEATSGKISIDGIDISSITLTALRERLTILPQEAQLFSGTVRENLDPFSDHDDEVIWEALRRCGLASRLTPGPSRLASRAASRAASVYEGSDTDGATAVEEKVMINSLEERVAKGGANYSAGQRQLLSLARGLLKLRHSSILILDESTANLDHATDEAIQRVLRDSLDGVTVITIAHRLRSVADCDRILVLDHGSVLEYDSPLALMKREDSAFSELCRRSGEESTLLRIAERAEEARSKHKRV